MRMLSSTVSAAFIQNQIFDIESDRTNKKLFLIGEHFTSEKARIISHILLISGLLISLLANWVTAVLTACIYLIWGIIYNQKPFEWKKRPVAGWFANILAGILLFIIGWILAKQNQTDMGLFHVNLDTIIHMLPYVLCFSSISLMTTLPDIKGDLALDAKTFPITFGKTSTLIISLLLVCIAFYIGIQQNDPVVSTATLVSLPFFLFSTFRRLDKDIIRSSRYPIFILNFFVLPFYPYLVVPLLIIYYMSKYYYWHRFNLHYPTFIVDHD